MDTEKHEDMIAKEEKYYVTGKYREAIDIHMVYARAISVDWLYELGFQVYIHYETVQLTVNYLDRYLELDYNPVSKHFRTVSKNNLQMVLIACLWIAIKFYDFPHAFCHIKTITRELKIVPSELVQMEVLVLTRLSYNLHAVTPYQWCQWYYAVMFQYGSSDLNLFILPKHKALKWSWLLNACRNPHLWHIVTYFISACMIDEVCYFGAYPSLLAACSVYVALQHTTRCHPDELLNFCEPIFSYTWDQMKTTVHHIQRYIGHLKTTFLHNLPTFSQILSDHKAQWVRYMVEDFVDTQEKRIRKEATKKTGIADDPDTKIVFSTDDLEKQKDCGIRHTQMFDIETQYSLIVFYHRPVILDS